MSMYVPTYYNDVTSTLRKFLKDDLCWIIIVLLVVVFETFCFLQDMFSFFFCFFSLLFFNDKEICRTREKSISILYLIRPS